MADGRHNNKDKPSCSECIFYQKTGVMLYARGEGYYHTTHETCRRMPPTPDGWPQIDPAMDWCAAMIRPTTKRGE